MALTTPSRLGAYEILSLLGVGGMGEVYLARDPRLGREVALKVLPADLAADPDPSAGSGSSRAQPRDERLARFAREARTVAALNHPNIVTLHSIEEADGLHFLTMERVTGRPLSDAIPAEGMALPRLLEIAIPVADALATAHVHGIVHRDLKPANVMVSDEGRVKVLDFGLARPRAPVLGDGQAGPTETVTAEGRIVGSVPYMAPEQLRGGRPEPRSDIFSFGVMLYEMATGARPFRGESTVDVVSAILRADPAPLDQVRPELPLRFVQLVRRCLEKSPLQRAQSAVDLQHDLQDLADELRSGAPVSGPASQVASATMAPPARRPWLRWGVALVALLTLVTAGAVLIPRLRSGSDGAGATADLTSVAVLPFANMAHDPSQDFFVEGIHEALITDLAKLGTLKVTSRNSVLRYKDHTLQLEDVARELGVDALIEGSVLRAGDKVRITAQLIMGATDEHAWAESYDRDVADVLGVLSDVSRSIAREVQARLGGQSATAGAPMEGAAPPVQARRVHPEALDAYLRARQALNNGLISAGTSVRYLTQSVLDAQKQFQQAVTVDPQYADAWSGLAFTTMSQAFFGLRPAADALGPAREAAGKALEIDPSQAEAYAALGFMDLFFEWRFDRAKLELEKALSLDPYDVHIRHGYADYLVAHGRARESVDQLRIARGHNPNAPWAHLLVLTHLHMASRDWNEVLAEARRVQAAFPTMSMPSGIIVDCLWRLGKYEEALRELRALDPEGAAVMETALKEEGPRAALKASAEAALEHVTPRTRPMTIAAAFADAGDRDTAFAWLEKAFAVRQPQLLYVPARSEWDGLRDDPRYIDVMRRIGLPLAAARP